MSGEELTNHVRMLVGSRLVRRDGVEYLSIPVYELVKRFKDYGDQRELAILEKLHDHEADSIAELAADLSIMIATRIAELKAKEVKGE